MSVWEFLLGVGGMIIDGSNDDIWNMKNLDGYRSKSSVLKAFVKPMTGTNSSESHIKILLFGRWSSSL